jgi:hypothetical protein
MLSAVEWLEFHPSQFLIEVFSGANAANNDFLQFLVHLIDDTKVSASVTRVQGAERTQYSAESLPKLRLTGLLLGLFYQIFSYLRKKLAGHSMSWK